jgi:hypothetical protein
LQFLNAQVKNALILAAKKEGKVSKLRVASFSISPDGYGAEMGERRRKEQDKSGEVVKVLIGIDPDQV